ncbi:MAG: 3-phosphoshikimate 1-carboxyvinyltransferase [Chitinophagaceae bacterium]|nr:3-phosphoshikimate 1-carboxyvinyltransferase [Chitinophagaceae bacterium]
MKVKITPSKINGVINAPASKSSMQRACAAALLRKGKTFIYNYGLSNDEKSVIEIIKNLGARVKFEKDYLLIESIGVNPISNNINCEESGLAIRMFTPIAALTNNEINIEGTGTLTTRPLDFFDTIFPLLQVKITSNNGKIPLKIKGPLQATTIEIDGSISSQFLTGLLFSFSNYFQNNTIENPITIKVNNLKSKPYIDLTLAIMQDFEMLLPENINYKEFVFHTDTTMHNKIAENIIYTVEGDWSNGAFLIVAAAIAGSITIKGLNIYSTQADKKIIEVVKNCGATISFSENEIFIKQAPLQAFEFDATDCPDLFPPLVSLAANCKGTSYIKGVHRLLHKESNRANALQEEFLKMGVEINIENDCMKITGAKKIMGATIYSHQDHRIAMACAVAALNANEAVCIENAEAVNKSYPNFFKDLELLGAFVKNN